ncbi:MAG: hypothetical protein P4L43_13430 [Syntrophobacteraceae bacterium]|nr:hypothetical protein [Syntrophobacteraceae bacterium]
MPVSAAMALVVYFLPTNRLIKPNPSHSPLFSLVRIPYALMALLGEFLKGEIKGLEAPGEPQGQ